MGNGGGRGGGGAFRVGCNLWKTWLRCQAMPNVLLSNDLPMLSQACCCPSHRRQTTTSWTTRRSFAAWASPTLRARASMRECDPIVVPPVAAAAGSCWRCTSLPRLPSCCTSLTRPPAGSCSRQPVCGVEVTCLCVCRRLRPFAFPAGTPPQAHSHARLSTTASELRPRSLVSSQPSL